MKKVIPPLNAAKTLFIRRYYKEKSKRQKARLDGIPYDIDNRIDQFQKVEIDKLLYMIQEKYKNMY